MRIESQLGAVAGSPPLPVLVLGDLGDLTQELALTCADRRIEGIDRCADRFLAGSADGVVPREHRFDPTPRV